MSSRRVTRSLQNEPWEVLIFPDMSQLTFKAGKFKSILSSPIEIPETARALATVEDALQWQSSKGLFIGLPPIGRNRLELESKACVLIKKRCEVQMMLI
jgi:hypothetical protein